MKLTLAEPRYLKDSVSIISDLVNEARFTITKDAVELVAMDPANVAMVVFKLLSSSFVEYTIKEDTSIAINLSNLKQVLARAKANDMLTLELDKDASRLIVKFKSNTIRTFSLPILDLEEKEQKVPELTFPITIETSSAVLNEAIEDADVVAESVNFIAEKNKLTLLAEGDLSNANIEISADDETKIQAEGMDKVKAKYSIEYMKKIIKGSKLSDRVKVQFNKDYPLKVEYKSVDKVLMTFILAPRVEND
ncbi:proliferating cell nuclear antigen (pcna) [Candidatus Woesearchaeota archaeon]|nr:proliferating cell nuclear antigen (pcna) [Candidatus Woesearchaeota archaeon]